MTIHHATIKKAAKFGVILTEVEDAGQTFAKAHLAELNIRLILKDPKQALAAVLMAKTLKSEYPAVTLTQSDRTEGYYGVAARVKDAEGVEHLISETSSCPLLADLLEFAEENGFDPELGYDESKGQVVPEKYKQVYAQRGNRNHCGDWLALQLEAQMVDQDGRMIEEDYTAFLVANGVELVGKWASLPTSDQKGWVGRYKMGGDQKLRKIIAGRGTLILGGATINAPIAYLEFLLEKHPSVTVEWGA